MKNFKQHYETVIVGGGIVGAGIFRDLSLHNINTLLIDKKRFASQTSSRSSKMLHGGIRYLENLDFKLVKEALQEKNLWLKIAPKYAQEKMFLMPVYKDSLRNLSSIWAGVYLYDVLSKFKNSSCKFYLKDQVLKQVPLIKQNGLKGGGLYADSIVDDKGLNKAIIKDALKNKNVDAKEDCEVLDFYPDKNGFLLKIKYLDTLKEISTNNLIVAAGPFTDQLLQKISFLKWNNCLLPSKGSHLWIKRKALNINQPVVLTPNDGRVIFIIPYQEKILVGTTEEKAEGDFFDVSPSEGEISYLLKNINEYFPTLKITSSDIESSFAGIRPLVRDTNSIDRSKTSREHKIFKPYNRLHIIAGGKFTTFRVMGQEITREIVLKNNRSYNPDLSKSPLS